MPYVNIRVAGPLSKEQKQNISKGVTEVIAKEANKPPEAVLIFIDEVNRERRTGLGDPAEANDALAGQLGAVAPGPAVARTG